MTQPALFNIAPRFDGVTFDAARDGDRLHALLDRVRIFTADQEWYTLAQIADACACSEASASARLRDLRKVKFGSYTVDRQYVARGLWRYRVTGGS